MLSSYKKVILFELKVINYDVFLEDTPSNENI